MFSFGSYPISNVHIKNKVKKKNYYFLDGENVRSASIQRTRRESHPIDKRPQGSHTKRMFDARQRIEFVEFVEKSDQCEQPIESDIYVHRRLAKRSANGKQQ